METSSYSIGLGSKTRPKVSVIIVTRGTRDTLPQTLDSLSKQTFTDFETLIVSNVSDYAKDLSQKWGCKFVQVPSEWFLGKVRNTAIDHSQGKIIVFIDDDCIASQSWLAELIAPIDNGSEATMGKVLPVSTNTLAERLAILDFDWGRKLKTLKTLATCNCAIKRRVFDRLRFTEVTHTSEDYALGRSIYASGYEIQYVPKAIVYHHHRSSLLAYWKQIFAWGRDYSVWAWKEQLQPFSTLEIMYALAGWFFVLGTLFLILGYIFPAQLMYVLALLWEIYPFRVYVQFLRWQLEDLPYDIGNLYVYAFHRFIKEKVFALGKVRGIFLVHKLFKEYIQ